MDSAGISMSRLPVRPPMAVPAPAPARPPTTRPTAAGGYSADEHAEAGASTDEGGGALAFALLGAGEITGRERVAGAVEGE